MDRERRDLTLIGSAQPIRAGRKDAPATTVSAQVLGQTGQKRGLKGGPAVLDQAKAAYLETEWSGPADRRIRAGRITKTEI